MSKLTLIIAVRSDDFSDYARRIQLRDRLDMRDVKTIIVDDGSPRPASAAIKSFCVERSYQYIRIDSELEPFSLSRARNAGIFAADTEWLCFEDADLIYPSNHYQRLIEELELLDETPFNFLTVPVVYLTESASEEVIATGSIDAHLARLMTAVLLESPTPSPLNKVVESYAPATSVIALRKSTALLVGAFDEAFSGWGGEDRDFAFRLLHANSSVLKPSLFSTTKNWNLNDTVAFEGWRALYRLVGDYLVMKGLHGFHIYHPHLPWRTGAKTNIEFASEKAKKLATSPAFAPIGNPGEPCDIVIGNNPHIVNEQVLSTLRNPRIIREDINTDPEVIADQIVRSFQIQNVFFWNPYGSPWRKQLYDILNARGVATIVGERGALPRALYFDRGGLSVESSSYEERHWPQYLSEDEVLSVRQYLETLRLGSISLEKQSARLGAGLLRMKMGIPADKKILFVPLQLSDDTVTTYFSEPDRSYEMFQFEVNRLSLMLPSDWIMVVKNHPLALEKSSISSVVYADSYHIHDLIEASNAICVFNSGVGLEALAFYKPTFCYGRAFYRIDGLNERFDSAPSVRDRLLDLPSVDSVMVHRFFHHLLNKVYSFADWTGRTEKKSSTSQVFKLESIHYTKLRIDGYQERDFIKREFNIKRSILFDRYRFHAVSSPKPATPAPKVIAAAPQASQAMPSNATNKHSLPPAATASVQHSTAKFNANEALAAGAEKFHSGDHDAAAKLFEAAALVKSSHVGAFRCAAEAYEKAGNRKKALEMLAIARDLAPNNRNLKQRNRYLMAPKWMKLFLPSSKYPVPQPSAPIAR